MFTDDEVKCALSMLTENNPTFAIINRRAREILGRDHWPVDGLVTFDDDDDEGDTMAVDLEKTKTNDTEWWTAHAAAVDELCDLMKALP